MLLKQLTLMYLRYWQNKLKIQFLKQLDHGYQKELHPNLNLPRFNNQNDFYGIARSSTSSESKKKDNSYATTNLLKFQTMKTYECFLPLSLFLACFILGHYNGTGAHMCTSKTYNFVKRSYHWPGMFDWIYALAAGCLTCHNNKLKPKQGNEVPLEEWRNENTPFHVIHIDHKGPPNPPSNRNLYCLFVIDAFSRFLMVYAVANTGAQATISAVEKWIHSFGNPQYFVHNRGTAFVNTEFVNWTKELGTTLQPRTAHSPRTKGKVETQNQQKARYWRNFLIDTGNNWYSQAPKFAFAHNTKVNYTAGKTPYEFVFGTKPQVPMSLNLGL